ncbi:hypothetical protein Asp14428_33310 [Actinoplanes sp. NBRC 14428]|nr:hypothetical protein Asp14428_33310 [Actinoplanes sp. NBRC 14428]
MSLQGFLIHERRLVVLRSRVRADARSSVGNRQTIAFTLSHAVALVRELPDAYRSEGTLGSLERARELSLALAESNHLVDESGRARRIARLVATAQAQLSVRDRAFGPHRWTARNLDRVLDVASVRSLALAQMCDRLARVMPTRVGESPREQPVGVALRLADRTARILPPLSQARYEEEFRSELFELAAAGATWWAQLRHTLRLFDRAWVLRAELHESTRDGITS